MPVLRTLMVLTPAIYVGLLSCTIIAIHNIRASGKGLELTRTKGANLIGLWSDSRADLACYHGPVMHHRDQIFRVSHATQAFGRLSLLQQFLLVIVVILVAGAVITGTWIGRQIESSSINRTAAIAAVYVESILAGQLHDQTVLGLMGGETHATLDRVFVSGPLRRKVVRFKLWSPTGTILYSSDHAQVGQQFPVDGRLAAAFAGNLQARVSNLEESDNPPERENWPQLLEVYVPVRAHGTAEIFAVAEFYHSMENLSRDIRSAQQRSWLLVAMTTMAICLLLLGLVRRANATILDQQRGLHSQLQQLRNALDDNEHMRKQLRDAGARSTALNEQLLHRVAADLHDGPAQEIAFALMRLDTLVDAFSGRAPPAGDASGEVQRIEEALRSALGDVRNIASGLALPGIENLTLADTARRAIQDFERLFGPGVETQIDDELATASLAVKITVYRLLQESLTNSWRHAPEGAPQVRVSREGEHVRVIISDRGPGFDPQGDAISGHLGLPFMRERVRLLGGAFAVRSAPGSGTSIDAKLLLFPEDAIHVQPDQHPAC